MKLILISEGWWLDPTEVHQVMETSKDKQRVVVVNFKNGNSGQLCFDSKEESEEFCNKVTKLINDSLIGKP